MVQDMVCTGLRATADVEIYTATTQSWYVQHCHAKTTSECSDCNIKYCEVHLVGTINGNINSKYTILKLYMQFVANCIC